MNNQIFNNNAIVSGVVVDTPVFSHEVHKEKFYKFNLAVMRLSEIGDIIPITISDRLIDLDTIIPVSTNVRIKGNFRSYNQKNIKGRSSLILYVFAREIEITETPRNENRIEVDGFVCREPIYRTTPLNREITDLLVAHNRPYGKSDYIPCITWGRSAKYVSTFNRGDVVHIVGRIQSRGYVKKINDTDFEQRTAYEVSIQEIEKGEVDGENSRENSESDC